MTRKRTTTLIMLAAMNAPAALGLGLGDITLNSGLDEPLSADIRLYGARDLTVHQIVVKLASSADFERAGVERLYALSDMKFTLELGAGGEGVIHVSTGRSFKEPYLDFVLEVRWPNGRVLREYTALVDLPTYRPGPQPQASAPVRQRSAASAPVTAGRSSGSFSGDSYEVSRGDTLWSIADRVRPAGVSIQRMMIALHESNPEAFIRGNINLLRAGVVLQVPEESEFASLSQDQAVSEVSSHAREWRASGPATEATDSTASAPVAGSSAASSSDEAYLRLAGDGSSASIDSGTGGGGGGRGELREQLAVTQESLSAAELANVELQERVKALEQQVQDYQKLVDLKSDEMSAATQTPAAGEDQEAEQTSPPPAAQAPAAQSPGLLESLLGNIWALVGAAVVIVGGLVAFMMRRRRGSAEEFSAIVARQGAAKPARESSVARQPAPVVPAPAVEEEEDRWEEDLAAEVAREPAPASVAEPEEEMAAPLATPAPAAAETSDPISEADIYVAYGRSERAVELLQTALARDATQTGVRLKLLEILAEIDDRRRFVEEYAALRESGDEDAVEEARELLSGSGRQGWLLDIESAASVGVREERQAQERAASAAQDDDFALDLESGAEDSPALDLEQELAELDTGAAESLGELELGADESLGELDLDADDEAVGELELGPEEAEAAADEGMGELDLGTEEGLGELDLGASEETVADEEAVAEADEDLDLLGDSDEIETKLELARAYVDMGDIDGAREILDEVLADGNEAQREQARELQARLES